MFKLILLFTFCTLGITNLNSQTYLRITNIKFGKVKVYDVYINDKIVFKLKGKHAYLTSRVVALSDSSIVLSNDIEIKLSQLKTLKLDVQNHLIKPFSFVFMVGGIAFLPLNSYNNWLMGTEPIFSQTAAFVSVGLIGTSVLIKQLGIRRVRLNKKTDLKVLSIDYQHLNVKR